jgi:hypothetical protein
LFKKIVKTVEKVSSNFDQLHVLFINGVKNDTGFIYQRTHYSFVNDLSIQGTITQSCQGFLISFVDDLSIQGTITHSCRGLQNITVRTIIKIVKRRKIENPNKKYIC